MWDVAKGHYRISSKAFGPSSSDGCLSGDLEQLLVEDGLSPTILCNSLRRAVGAVSVSIGQIRALGLCVAHDPVSENWYHGAISGIKKATKDKLRKSAVEIVPIDQEQVARHFRDSGYPV